MPTSHFSFLFCLHLKLNNKPTVVRLSYIFFDSSISRDPRLLNKPLSINHPHPPVVTLSLAVFIEAIGPMSIGSSYPKIQVMVKDNALSPKERL